MKLGVFCGAGHATVSVSAKNNSGKGSSATVVVLINAREVSDQRCKYLEAISIFVPEIVREILLSLEPDSHFGVGIDLMLSNFLPDLGQKNLYLLCRPSKIGEGP